MGRLMQRIFWGTGPMFGLAMMPLMALFFAAPLLFQDGGIDWTAAAQAGLIGAGSGLAGGAFFGAAMALILGLLHRWGARHVPEDRRYRVDQEDSRRVALAPDMAFEAARHALDGLRHKEIARDDRTRTIRARIGRSRDSFGEHLHIRVTPEGPAARVHVESRPIIGRTVADYGKNWRNVRAVLDHPALNPPAAREARV